MARLRTMPPRVSPAPSRLAPAPVTAGTGFARTDGLSSTARGYGQDWRRARLKHLASEPLCRFCAEDGRVTAADQVDHIEPFGGIDDPLRLADSNLRSLCGDCHLARSARQASGAAEPRQGGGGRISGIDGSRDRVPPHAEVFSGGE